MKTLLLLALALAGTAAPAAEPVPLEARFQSDAVKFVREPGTATVSGKAFLRLKDGTLKDCAGFAIELLPVAPYSNERIFKTYGNNERGQILLEQNPPKFTPDAPEYHEMLLKGACDATGVFRFTQVPAGDYYVMAFLIWEQGGAKAGGAAMKRIHVDAGATIETELRN